MRRVSIQLRGAGREMAHSSSSLAEENEGDYDKDVRTAMQKKTFRRWCNSYLDDRKLVLNHILNDWQDGVLLVNLLEVLSETSLPKYSKTPKLKVQKIENLNNCIKFITKVAKISLVNIGSEDIFKGNQTIIMGLIWTLILRWGLKLKDGKSGLLNWAIARTKTQGVEVKNFTTSWQNGMAFCALIASYRPDLVDMSQCSEGAPLENMEAAFNAAEKNYDIERLLDPNDVLFNPDEKSIVAYIGQLHTVFSKPPPTNDGTAAATLDPDASAAAADDTSANGDSSAAARRESAAIPAKKLSETIPTKKLSEVAASRRTSESTIPAKRLSEISASGRASDLTAGRRASAALGAKIGEEEPEVETFPIIPVEEKKEEAEPLLQQPDAPVISTPSNTSVNVEWNVVPNATKTRVQIIEENGSWDSVLKSEDHPSTLSSCTLKKLVPGKAYKARVIAIKSGLISSRESEPSDESSFETRALGAPDGPIVSNETLTSVDVTWTKPDEETGMFIHLQVREDPNDWKDATVLDFDSETTAYKMENLKSGTRYDFRVVHHGEHGTTPPSVPATVVTKFAPMAKPVTDNTSETTTQLSWEPVPNATSYRIEILTLPTPVGADSTDPPADDAWEDARKVDAYGSPVVIDELQPGATSYFRVMATTDVGATPPSESAFVSLPAASMETPSVNMIGESALELNWQAYPDAQKYRIEIRNPDTEDWSEARVEEVTAPETSCKVDEFEPATNYEVRVTAITPTLESEPSFPVTVTTPPTTRTLGKIALVTGANSKKGCELVKALLNEGSGFWSWSSGYSLVFVCTHRSSVELQALADKYKQLRVILLDTTKVDTVKEAARLLHKEAPYIDVFINNGAFSAETIAILMGRPE